jgi:hypothetical protein
MIVILVFSVLAISLSSYSFHSSEALGGGGGGPPPGSGINEVVTADNGNSVYVMWAEYDDKKHDYTKWIRASHDAGRTFEKVIDLNNVLGTKNRSSFVQFTNIQMAASGPNNLYLAWGAQDINNSENDPSAPYHAYFMRSADGGRTFSPPAVLDLTAKELDHMEQNKTALGGYGIEKLMVSGGLVYVIMGYTENSANSKWGFLLKTSSDGGETFSDAVDIFSSPEIGESWIQIATSSDSNNFYAVSTGRNSFDGNVANGNIGVLFKASYDSGKSFGKTIDLNEGTNAAIFAPKIAASGKNNVYVAWSEMDPSDKSNTYAYFRASNDRGKTFGEKIELDSIEVNPSEIVNSNFVQVAANKDNENDNNVYVRWRNVHFSHNLTTEKDHLLIRASNDGGRTFGGPIDLTGNQTHTDDGGQPLIAVVSSGQSSSTSTIADMDNVYAAWTADTDFPIASSKAFVSRSIDGGQSFDTIARPPEQVNDKNEALNLRMAAAAKNVYLAWDSGSPNVHGLFFAASNDAGNSFGGVIDLVESPEKQVAEPQFGSYAAVIIVVLVIAGAIATTRRFTKK